MYTQLQMVPEIGMRYVNNFKFFCPGLVSRGFFIFAARKLSLYIRPTTC